MEFLVACSHVLLQSVHHSTCLHACMQLCTNPFTATAAPTGTCDLGAQERTCGA